MKVLLFQAAVSSLAVAAMTSAADTLREHGYKVGVRNLAHFNGEMEPTEKVIVALTDDQAKTHEAQLKALVEAYGDRAVPLPLPAGDADTTADEALAKFDWSEVVEKLGDPGNEDMSLDGLRASAMERGLDFTSETTSDQLRQMLDLAGDPAGQANERAADRKSMTEGQTEPVAGARQEGEFAELNEVALSRMNDSQLKATATRLGITVPNNIRRDTLIKKILKTPTEQADADGEGEDDKGDADGENKDES